jgi:hypothetical protein
MPFDLPTSLDLPREAATVDAEHAAVGARRLHQSLGSGAVVVVALDPALEHGEVVIPFLPMSGLASLPASRNPWLRLEVQGWEAEAIAALDAAGVLASASAVEVDVGVAEGIGTSPSLTWMTGRLAPRFSLAMITPTHGDPTTGVTWLARAVFVQPST